MSGGAAQPQDRTLSLSTSLASLRCSSAMEATRASSLSGCTLSDVASAFTIVSRAESKSYMPGPDTASMRRTPAAIPDSDTIWQVALSDGKRARHSLCAP